MKSQRGATLFICLMILLVISLLAISALRMSMSQAQVATSSLASDLVFMSAETGINKLVAEGEADVVTRAILPSAYGSPTVRCVSSGSTTTTAASSGSCDSVYSDAKGIANTKVTIFMPNPDDPDVGQRNLQAMVKFGSVPGVVIENFVIESTAKVSAVDVSTTNVQEVIFPHL